MTGMRRSAAAGRLPGHIPALLQQNQMLGHEREPWGAQQRV